MSKYLDEKGLKKLIESMKISTSEGNSNNGNYLKTDMSNIEQNGINYINGLVENYINNLDAREVNY